MKLRAGGLNWTWSKNQAIKIMALPVLALALLIGLIGPGEQAAAGTPAGKPLASNQSSKVERAVLELMRHARHVRQIQFINGLKPGQLTAALDGEPVGTIIHV